MKQILILIIFLFVFSGPVSASGKIIINADKTSLFGEEELQINASASGFASDGAIFAKGVFFKENSTNYFGYTKSGDLWVKNSASAADQLNVNFKDWNGIVRIKNDPADSGFIGSGDYFVKLGYYYNTSSGKLSSVNWSENSLAIKLTAPVPTATPSPHPTKSPVASALKTATPRASQSGVPIPEKVISSPKPVMLITKTESQEKLNVTPIASAENKVLGQEAASENIKSADPKSKPPNIAFFLVGTGIVLIGFSVFLALKTIKSGQIQISS